MNKTISIITKDRNIFIELLGKYFDARDYEYRILSRQPKSDMDIVIHIGSVPASSYNGKQSIVILDKPSIIDNAHDYIITPLINANDTYSESQKDYLLQLGNYVEIFNTIDFLINKEQSNGTICDMSHVSIAPTWIIKLDDETSVYTWLKKYNLKNRKVINFYSDNIYDDSYNEINYCTNKLNAIESGVEIIDLFLLDENEMEKFSKNYFYKILSTTNKPNYKFAIIDKSKIDSDVIKDILDGIIIYEDCVYRDIYTEDSIFAEIYCDTISLEKYNRIFDYLLSLI